MLLTCSVSNRSFLLRELTRCRNTVECLCVITSWSMCEISLMQWGNITDGSPQCPQGGILPGPPPLVLQFSVSACWRHAAPSQEVIMVVSAVVPCGHLLQGTESTTQSTPEAERRLVPIVDHLAVGNFKQVQEGRSPAPTHIPCSFQISLNDLISWIGCV